MFGLTVLLVSALLLVIGNTIRLHIENRRTEIEVIKLVGGTDSYVRRPFLYMGALYGLGAGILSWGVLAFGLDWLNDAVVGLAGLYGCDFALAGIAGSRWSEVSCLARCCWGISVRGLRWHGIYVSWRRSS